MNPTVPTSQPVSAPPRTASRPAQRDARTTSASAASRWAASARTMPKGMPPAAFAQTLAQASKARESGRTRAAQNTSGRNLPIQQNQLQMLQAMFDDGAGDGQMSLFGNGQGTPGQTELLQFLTQRLAAVTSAAPAAAAPAPAATATPASNATRGVLDLPNGLGAIVQQAADKYGVDPALIAGVIETESNFNAGAVSRAGARGLMQLMPGTARGLGVTDANDPLQNVLGGAKLLGQMLDKYKGNVELALAAYNAGSGNVDKYGGIPPFSETRRYVPTVLAAYERFRQAPAAQATATSQPAAQPAAQPTGQTDSRARRS